MSFNFITIQDEVRDAIKLHADFAPNAANTICSDCGLAKRFLENAVATYGYSVSVWPPTKGNANHNEDAHQGVECVLVVRLQVNPQQLQTVRDAHIADNTKPTQGNYLCQFVSDIIQQVLNITPSPTGVRFKLAPDAFDLVSFDEGLIAYHIRFQRFAAFGG